MLKDFPHVKVAQCAITLFAAVFALLIMLVLSNQAFAALVTYHNGNNGIIMHNARNHLIFWLPSGTNPEDNNNPYTFDNPRID